MPEWGRVTEWNDVRGFGFITHVGDQSRVFVHISAFRHGQRRPVLDDLVCHENGGRPLSAGVAVGVAAPFILLICVLSATRLLPLLVAIIYITLSVWLFAVYGLDKRAALLGEWRASEASLHVMALLGGWPGALVAQRVFHHKTRKQPFHTIFRATVALNCVGLAAFLVVPLAVPG